MECNGCNEQDVLRLSNEIFKTDDYESILSILPAYDGMVREFNRRIGKLKDGEGEA